MGWALVHWQQRRNFLILIWFWSVVITGGMLTESPPSSQRLVIAIPAMALLVAIGMERTAGLLRQLLAPRHKPWANILLAVLIVGLAVGAIHFYFIEFTPERRYGSVNGETAPRPTFSELRASTGALAR
jgi:amino acid transporter